MLKKKPFLKWPGGKSWLINKNIIKLFPENINHYYEPFLGGGALFFALEPSKAVLSDINEELINLYKLMRDRPEKVKSILIEHNKNHNKEYYYQIRNTELECDVERAARLLYLNRTCFNGMYRVNKQGKFNVPIGTKTNCIYDIDMFSEYSHTLKKAEILVSDFEELIDRANENDLVFADPPYITGEKCDGFIKYNDNLFSWRDQQRLHDALVRARNRNVNIVLTNVNCQDIRDLYEESGFDISVLERASTISGKASKRNKIKELFITSF